MQKQRMRTIGVIAAAVMVVVSVSPAFGGAWLTPSGNTDSIGGALDYSYSNGKDINGLFSNPFIFGNAFFFSTAFSTSAAGGASSVQSDTMSVDILADPGFKFGSISVSASGTYSIDTDGTVDVSANLSMTENTGLLRSFSDALTTDVAFPTSVPTAGLGVAFSGSAMVDVEFVFPAPSNDIHIELSNNILVMSGAGGSASVNINFADLELSFNVIPEPASASLMALGFLALIRRRRRR